MVRKMQGCFVKIRCEIKAYFHKKAVLKEYLYDFDAKKFTQS